MKNSIKNIKYSKKSVIDFYIFIDYSADLIGYNIIKKEKNTINIAENDWTLLSTVPME